MSPAPSISSSLPIRRYWDFPREHRLHAEQWRWLLTFCAARADRARFAAEDEAPRITSLQLRWPFFCARRGPAAATIFAAVGSTLGPPLERTSSCDRWACRQRFSSTFVFYALTKSVVRYVLDTCELSDGWSQLDGLPEDPTLLRAGRPLVEAISHDGEVLVELSADELEEAARHGLQLIPCASEVPSVAPARGEPSPSA